MGADNWEPCPRCVDRAKEAYVQVLSEHGAKYGTVSIEEWAELCANLQPAPDLGDRDLRTFREDYEWWIDDETATLHGVFRGTCTTCGLSVKHEVEPIQFYVREVKS